MKFDFELDERAAEDRAAPDYDRLYHGFPIPRYWDDTFVELVAATWANGDRVLDLGCATASLWESWLELPETARLVGVDISEEMIRRARAKYPDGEFHVARAHELPFEAGSFDVVVVSSVLHHIPDKRLEGAFAEIVRVLDEHGRLVGREPLHNRFASTPGWFSGAVMDFRHFVYRLTRSREFPEPALGEHHHVFDLEAFMRIASQQLTLTTVERRFTFSSFLSRVTDERITRLARHLDQLLAGRGGGMFHYVAEKNYVPAAEVVRVIGLARDEVEPVSDAQFLAYLQAATVEIERLFAEDGSTSRVGDGDSSGPS